MSNIGGLRFNGATDWLVLPSIAFTSIQIDCLLDSGLTYQYILGSSGHMLRIDAGGTFEGSGVTWTGAMIGTRTTITINSTTFSGSYTIFANTSSGGGVTLGTLYTVKMYNNSSLVLSYDLTQQSNIQGNKVYDSVSGTYNGTLYGSPQFIGVQQEGLIFNASNVQNSSDYISLPNVMVDTVEICFNSFGKQFLSASYLLGTSDGSYAININTSNNQLTGTPSVWSHMYLDGVDILPTFNSTATLIRNQKHTIKATATSAFSVNGALIMTSYNKTWTHSGEVYYVKLWSSSNLVAYYDFTNPFNGVKDISGNGKNGTLYGSPQWAIKPEQQGVQFNGVSDYVDCGSNTAYNLSATQPITLEAWVYINDSNGGYQSIISKSNALFANGFWLYHYQNASGLNIYLGNWGLSFTYNLTSRTWTHIAVTYDPTLASNQVSCYVNGTLVKIGTTSGTPIVTPTANMNIGSYNGANYKWRGNIGAVRYYTRVLSKNEILSNYNGQVARSGLLGEWCIDPSGKDTSGNNNNGTLTGTQANIKKEVQGIQFNGVSDMFKTPITNTSFDTIEIDFVLDANQFNGYTYLFDFRTDFSTNEFLYFSSSTTTFYGQWNYTQWKHIYVDGVDMWVSGSNSSASPIQSGQRHTIKMVLTSPITKAGWFMSQFGGSNWHGKGRIYSVKLWNGTTLVSQYIDPTGKDTSGNGNNGTLTGTKPNIKVIPQQGMTFGGGMDGITAPSNLSIDTVVMDLMLIQPNPSNIAMFFDFRNASGYYAYQNGTSILNGVSVNSLTVNGVTQTPTSYILPNYQRTTMQFKFTNGVISTGSDGIFMSSQGNGYGMKGILYSVKYYNAGTLVLSYDLTKPSNIQGNTVLDLSGNGRNGTLSGSPKFAIKTPLR